MALNVLLVPSLPMHEPAFSKKGKDTFITRDNFTWSRMTNYGK